MFKIANLEQPKFSLCPHLFFPLLIKPPSLFLIFLALLPNRLIYFSIPNILFISKNWYGRIFLRICFLLCFNLAVGIVEERCPLGLRQLLPNFTFPDFCLVFGNVDKVVQYVGSLQFFALNILVNRCKHAINSQSEVENCLVECLFFCLIFCSWSFRFCSCGRLSSRVFRFISG